jgi:tetratricopeptide (TPR) repeat protein
MKLLQMSFVLFVLCLVPVAAQENGAPQPKPTPTPAPVPLPQDSAVTKKEAENLNAAIVAARNATKEKRYADSEAIMLRVTQQNPNLVLPWLELGLAQLGLKKYAEAESDFKIAIGTDEASVQREHNNDFYQKVDAPGVVAAGATRSSRNAVGSVVNSGEKRTPEILGTGWASLGEIYVRQGKVAEGQAAFDEAVKANPADVAFYRHNETIFFFQVGNSDAQLAAAEQAIAADPARAANYYFKGQALVSKASIDPKTQKMILPPGCAEAYQKYLELDPNGPYSADAKGVLTAVGIPIKPTKKV